MTDSRTITRRRLLAGAGTAAAYGALAAACAPIAGPGPVGASPTGAATTAAASPKRGGLVAYGQVFALQTTDPHPFTGSTTAFREQIFDTMVSMAPKGAPQPRLAESWTVAPDRSAVTFKLRQGVKFHSGRDFDAEAAKWNIEYAQDAKSRAQPGAQLRGIAVTAKDKYTLELRFQRPTPQIFSLLIGVPIIDPSSDIAKAAGGTGPFKLEGLTPGDQMRLIRNESYWRQGYPLLDGFTIKVVPDAGALVLGLESGAIHAIQSPLSEASRLSSGATKTLREAGPGNYDFLLSAVDPPFTDKRVRQAVGLAVDRKRIADAALFGQAQPAYTIWPRSSPAHDPALDTGEFDLDKAKQLLTQAGHPNGFETKIQASRAAAPEQFQMSQILQADLAKIGIRATVENLESAQLSGIITNATFTALASHNYAFGDQDPALLFTAQPFNPAANASRFKSDEYARLVQQAQVEADDAKRIATYRDIAKLVKEEAFILPVANWPRIWAMRSNLQGVRVTGLYMLNFEEASLA